jgi:transcriptional regulator with XRE-family HTH domain
MPNRVKKQDLIFKNLKRVGEVDRRIGKVLRDTREDAGISRRELGKALGVSDQQIYKYELGYNRLSVGALLKIFKFMDISLMSFFEQIDTQTLNTMGE